MLVSEQAAVNLTGNFERRDAFIAAALSEGCTPAQIIAALMGEDIGRRQLAGNEDALLREQVEEGRASMRAGIGVPNALVEAESAEWCAALLRNA